MENIRTKSTSIRKQLDKLPLNKDEHSFENHFAKYKKIGTRWQLTLAQEFWKLIYIILQKNQITLADSCGFIAEVRMQCSFKLREDLDFFNKKTH